MKKPAVLFVCLGNICRSPLAEAAFRQEAAKAKLDAEIDSAGIGGWHAGEPPDRRAQAVARNHGIDISSYRARKVTKEDFSRFTYILALDHDNLAALEALRPEGSNAEVHLLLDYVSGRNGEAVDDPWYGSAADFEVTWSDVLQGAKGLVRALVEGCG